ncbi:branched-chain amino acid ABC transporter ATP-binding protein/permease [Luteimonas sp. RIT-PG2_3]
MLLPAAGWAALILVVALVGHLLGGGAERTLTLFMITLAATVGMGVYCGNSGVLSFGHLSFMAVGAYVSGLLTLPVVLKHAVLPHLPDWLAQLQWGLPAALVAALMVAVGVALLTGLLISRLEAASATIATLGLLIIMHGLIIGARDLTRGSQAFFGVPRDTGLWLAAGAAIAVVVLARLFRDSVPGLKLRAARDDALAARSTGIAIERQRLLAWVISGAMVAVSGALLAHFLGTFSPQKFYFTDTFLLLAMLIVGGMGSVSGAVAGTALITLIAELLRHAEGGLQLFGMQTPPLFGAAQIGIALAILLVMSRRREGLVGDREWDEVLAARRQHAPAPVDTPVDAASDGIAPAPVPGNATTHSAPPGQRHSRLEGQALTRRFGGLVAVNAVDVNLQQGEILGLIGPNGSGKSTLLSLLSGVLAPSEGRLQLDGAPLLGLPAQVFARRGIARTFQNTRLFDSLSVRQNVLVAALHGWPKTPRHDAEARADQLLAELGLSAQASARADALSYGERRRVEIARALALSPRFLFLDEPAAGMNHDETADLMRRLQVLRQRYALGIVIVDHDLPLITGLCDRVIVLNEGRLIAAGTPHAVQRDPAVVEAYLGRRHAAATPDAPDA